MKLSPAPRMLLATLALAASACGPKGPATIAVGVAGPMTGDQAKQGKDMQNGVKLAADKWNREKGGLLGKKIEVLVEDDQQKPDQANNIATKFANEGVAGVVGHFNSSCTIPATEIYDRKNIVSITPASTNEKVTDRRLARVFRVCGRDDQQGLTGAKYVAEKMPEAKVAIIHDKTTYGEGLAKQFQQNYERLTSKQAVFFSGIVREDQDFTAVLTSLKPLSPDVIYFGGLYTQCALLVKQAKQLGIGARWFSGDGTYDPEYIRIAGKENAEGTLLTFIPDQTKIATAKPVLAEYEKAYGEVGPYSIYSYTAAQVLFEGIEKAGSTDGAAVAKAIHELTFATPFGTLRFDDKGDVTESPYVVWDTKDGKFVQITGI